MIPVSLLQKQEKYEKVPEIFIETTRARARPKKSFFLKIENEDDIKEAKKAKVPIMRVTRQEMAIFNYPMEMPMQIIVPREYRDIVESRSKVHTFESMEPFKEVVPRIEDIIVFMMKFDLIAARALFERNRELVDSGYLQKRSYQENVEEEAKRIGVLPGGEQLALARAAAKNKVRRVLP